MVTTTTITAIIPAHNEVATLPRTVRSLREQTVPPDRVLVVSDNSTDATPDVARELGVDVMETRDNIDRKAGALNQALGTELRAVSNSPDYVLVVDADTQLNPRWVETALEHMSTNPSVGGVGAVFRAPPPTSYLTLCQSLEWFRYEEETERTGKTFVMSGTASLISAEALHGLYTARGYYYSPNSICEDSELSSALKSAGWALKSPPECTVVTETMPTVRLLFQQRRRWYLGALQNVSKHGLTPTTRPYIRQQVFLALGVLLMSLYLTLTAAGLILNGLTAPNPWWLMVTLVFSLERTITAWKAPPSHRLFAALVLPELVYAIFLQVAYVAAVFQHVTGSSGTWSHVPQPTTT